MIEDIEGPDGIVAAGGYWSARIAYVLGEPKKANYYLTRAALKRKNILWFFSNGVIRLSSIIQILICQSLVNNLIQENC